MGTTTTFPAVALRELEPREAGTYDKRTGLYIIQRRWEIMGLDWSDTLSVYTAALLGTVIPATFIQTYTEDGVTPVTMVAVTRHTEKMAEKPDSTPCCYLTVTYEGHACMMPLSGHSTTTFPAGYPFFNGVVSGHFEFGTKSEQILVSFDRDAAGLRRPIGTAGQWEGTNRLVPNCRLVIIQNMTEADFANRVPMIAGLIGLVNEDLWRDPAISAKSGYDWRWYEGMWLYLGAQVTQNRDGTITLQHQFEFDARPKPIDITSTTAGNVSKRFSPGWFYFHKFLWYDKMPDPYTNPSTGITKIVNRPVEPPNYSTIYETAGPTVALGYRFADLFLAQEVL